VVESSLEETAPEPQLRVVAPPGVFRPRSDTWLLADVLRTDRELRGSAVLDVCTGSGALAVAAARAGAREVTAVDVSRRAVLATRLNARLNGVRVKVLRGDLFAPVRGARFDTIVSNPPYLPAADDELPRSGPARAWDAGVNGRVLLDRIADAAPAALRPGGVLLLIHSSLIGVNETLERLRDRGLQDVTVRASRRGPLGPLLASRAAELERRGLLQEGQREEELVVIRAQRSRFAVPGPGRRSLTREKE
jgi:release factor glutamine methyltransferase